MKKISSLLQIQNLRGVAPGRPFACGGMMLADHDVCNFSALRAEKLHTIEMENMAVPEHVEATY